MVLKEDGATPWWTLWKPLGYFLGCHQDWSGQPDAAESCSLQKKSHTTKTRLECHGTFHIPARHSCRWKACQKWCELKPNAMLHMNTKYLIFEWLLHFFTLHWIFQNASAEKIDGFLLFRTLLKVLCHFRNLHHHHQSCAWYLSYQYNKTQISLFSAVTSIVTIHISVRMRTSLYYWCGHAQGFEWRITYLTGTYSTSISPV